MVHPPFPPHCPTQHSSCASPPQSKLEANRRWLDENREAAKYGAAEPHKITYLAIKKPKNSKEGEVSTASYGHSGRSLV